MQKDMHFYGVYALARSAGIKAAAAEIIAKSSQFVDDAIDDEAIELDDKRAVLPTMTSHKPIDYQNTIPGDQWKVWVPFHFLPGNDGNAGSFVERMVCTKDSYPAKKILEHALEHKNKSFGPHLAGITAHVYADTFAHYGFIGLNREFNKVNNSTIKIHVRKRSIINYIKAKFEIFKTKVAGTLAETVPVGHGAVSTFPDRPYLSWEYEREDGKCVKRNNLDDFVKASERLHAFFCEFVNNNSQYGDPADSVSWDSISGKVQNILKEEGTKEERITLWKDAISSNDLFLSTDLDRNIGYSGKTWRSAFIAYHFAEGGTAENCDACQFIQAAWKYRNYVLYDLLPGIGLIV